MIHPCCLPVETGQDEAGKKIDNCCAPLHASIGRTVAVTPSNRCPACGQKGKKVERLMLKVMLEVSLLAIRDVSYLFCRTAACPVVYFSADGSQSFTKAQIRVSVYQEEPHDESVLVCYCFYHSLATLRAEWLRTGASSAKAEIAQGIKAGQCACEVRNPQGSCCLGNVQVILEQLTHEIAANKGSKIAQGGNER
jgi:hypothetical protein